MSKNKSLAHVVAVNMGYGHERPAHSLRHLASKGKIIIANDYDKEICVWHEREYCKHLLEQEKNG